MSGMWLLIHTFKQNIFNCLQQRSLGTSISLSFSVVSLELLINFPSHWWLQCPFHQVKGHLYIGILVFILILWAETDQCIFLQQLAMLWQKDVNMIATNLFNQFRVAEGETKNTVHFIYLSFEDRTCLSVVVSGIQGNVENFKHFTPCFTGKRKTTLDVHHYEQQRENKHSISVSNKC